MEGEPKKRKNGDKKKHGGGVPKVVDEKRLRQMFAEGYSNKEIAAELNVTPGRISQLKLRLGLVSAKDIDDLKKKVGGPVAENMAKKLSAPVEDRAPEAVKDKNISFRDALTEVGLTPAYRAWKLKGIIDNAEDRLALQALELASKASGDFRDGTQVNIGTLSIDSLASQVMLGRRTEALRNSIEMKNSGNNPEIFEIDEMGSTPEQNTLRGAADVINHKEDKR